MRRGWTVSGGGDYTGKPHPAVIVPDDGFDGTASIAICPFKTDTAEAPLMRLPIEPDGRTGSMRCLMVDKITTVSTRKIGRRTGELDGEDIERLDQAMAIFLGLMVSQEDVCLKAMTAPLEKRQSGSTSTV